MATTLNKTLPDLSKLEPVDGNNYKRWSQKLVILFEQLEVDYVLFNDPPTDTVANIVIADDDAKKKFEKDNKTKYGVDDAGKKKYVVGKWIKFQMVDDKPIIEHVHECENLTADVLNEGMEMNQLKYKKKNLTLQELISHMRTEEANRLKDEEFKGKQKKGQEKKRHVKKQNYFNKPEGHIQKSKGPFYVCGKIGHKAFQCNQRQGQSSKNGGKAPVQANITKGGDVIVVVVVEANMVANKTDWIVDIGASRHLCANKELFHDFEESTNGECVYIGNSTTAGVMELLFPVGGDFVGKGCLSGGLFVLNIAQEITNNASTFNSSYIAESIDLWHEAKHTKKPFKNVTSRKTELLELVHSDLANFKNIVSKGGKKYYITFVDDFSRYTKVYLLKSKDAEFFEHVFPLKNNVSSDMPNNASTSMPVNSHIVPFSSVTANEHENKLRRSKRRRTEANFGPEFITTFLTENIDLDVLSNELVSIYLIEEDSKTYSEAIRSINASFWKEDIKSELDSIVCNHTWDLTDLPKGCKHISSKWIFKKKLRPDGTIEKYQARLVIRGFNQKKDIDYFNTYSPVTKIATIRTLVALAAIHNLVIHQMVKTAFLNDDLKEEIYMSQPEGFVIQGQKNKVCKLRKSLYGLKQAPKQWYEKFNSTSVVNGFVVNAFDTCVYSKMIGSVCVIICFYVDDMLIFGPNVNVVNETKKFLSYKFEMKDLGEADVILGVKIKRTSNGCSFSQSHYIEKMLKRFNCFDVAPMRTPYDPSIHLKRNKESSISQTEYAKIIGSVIFLMNYTRPDIAYDVSRLKVFCDANWVTDNNKVRSTSGYVFTLDAGQEAEWLRNLLADMPLWRRQASLVSLHCDSQAAIGIAKNIVYNEKRRHIRIRHDTVKQLLKYGIISLEYVRSERNLADPLTKGLARRVILETSRGMGLKPMD
ncbi:uncharacterized protein LOC142162334 [Nicotiana tabacum]|uniref:Uncharacterized protein LOC142162334 n=1 Tax=Nicotiana tabacum TaxID=4097 RepID=A0AC58RPV6_TOBAC